jgi:protein-S-isoprenylcysteine O-methyltransferase Ste14
VISIVLLSSNNSNPLIDVVVTTICPSSALQELVKLSPVFITGVIMLSIGVLIRMWCYKALGKLFTYEITIRPNHKLVTSGPYAFVRHPSYTGSLFLLTGTVITTVGPNSYAHACGIMNAGILQLISLSWSVWIFYVIYSLFSRAPVEDAELRKTFGKEWTDYSGRVAWRCIPGIF